MELHPQMMNSLLAINNFLLLLVIIIVGFNPAIPGMADIVTSDLFLIFISSKLERILVFVNLNFFNF